MLLILFESEYQCFQIHQLLEVLLLVVVRASPDVLRTSLRICEGFQREKTKGNRSHRKSWKIYLALRRYPRTVQYQATKVRYIWILHKWMTRCEPETMCEKPVGGFDRLWSALTSFDQQSVLHYYILLYIQCTGKWEFPLHPKIT